VERLWIGLGALAGLASVALAALGAHGLDAIGLARLQMVRNAVQIGGWHALVLLFCGLWARRGGRLVDWAGAAFALGTVLFCGAVCALAIGQVPVGILAPFGGTLLIAGWVLLFVSALVQQ
jgi:uncharacterized membrane protein YgdD (TMEM256/DUF423 family)